MHVPDGFVDAGTSLGAGAVALGAVGVAVRRTGDTLAERQVPLAALTAAFIFAAQMLAFPVAAGTSGHLMGGVLAAVLVGPWAGLLCITVVLSVQALLFADGGLSALGINIVNLGVVGALGGYLVYAGLRRLLAVRPAAALAAFASLPLAAAALTVEMAVGANVDIATADVALAMIGTHVLIGIGEGVITSLALGAVLAARPDLVAEGGGPDGSPPEVRASPVAGDAT